MASRRPSQSNRSNFLDDELRGCDPNVPLLYAWLFKRSYFAAKGKQDDKTHLLMNGIGGGVITVPEDAMDLMYQVFAKDVMRGYEIPLIELRTEYFAWFTDADIYGPRALRDKEIVDYCRSVQDSIKLFFPNPESTESGSSENDSIRTNKPNTFDMVILLVKNKPMQGQSSTESEDSIKTGIHMVMPNLHVTAPQCLALRMMIVAGLYDRHGEWPGFNKLEDQIDRSVYVGNGIRVPGSSKFGKCDRCKNDKDAKANCPRCMGKGKCTMGRQYFPAHYLLSNGTTSMRELENFENVARMISRCTVRRNGPSTRHAPFVEPLGAPVDPKENDLYYTSGQKRKGAPLTEDEIGIRGFGRGKKLIEGGSAFELVELLVQRVATTQFASMLKDQPVSLRLDRLYSISSEKRYTALIRGSCENWCSNLIRGRKHRGNRHFWSIRPCGIQQQCFCQCEKLDGRVGTTYCRDYRGPSHALQAEELKILFPDHATNNDMLQFNMGTKPNNKKMMAAQIWRCVEKESVIVYGADPELSTVDPTSKVKRRKPFNR